MTSMACIKITSRQNLDGKMGEADTKRSQMGIARALGRGEFRGKRASFMGGTQSTATVSPYCRGLHAASPPLLLKDRAVTPAWLSHQPKIPYGICAPRLWQHLLPLSPPFSYSAIRDSVFLGGMRDTPPVGCLHGCSFCFERSSLRPPRGGFSISLQPLLNVIF